MFQPTHPHGVRRHSTHRVVLYGCFNPRTRTGCDVPGVRQSASPQVSTHAPARGATGTRAYGVAVATFQPTHPHGVRPGKPFFWGDLVRFNPRTRTGCDSRYLSGKAPLSKFQPTHPHGVRQFWSSKSITAS